MRTEETKPRAQRSQTRTPDAAVPWPKRTPERQVGGKHPVHQPPAAPRADPPPQALWVNLPAIAADEQVVRLALGRHHRPGGRRRWLGGGGDRSQQHAAGGKGGGRGTGAVLVAAAQQPRARHGGGTASVRSAAATGATVAAPGQRSRPDRVRSRRGRGGGSRPLPASSGGRNANVQSKWSSRELRGVAFTPGPSATMGICRATAGTARATTSASAGACGKHPPAHLPAAAPVEQRTGARRLRSDACCSPPGRSAKEPPAPPKEPPAPVGCRAGA